MDFYGWVFLTGGFLRELGKLMVFLKREEGLGVGGVGGVGCYKYGNRNAPKAFYVGGS